MENKKFYWLRLQKDFFKRHDIRIVESLPNGKDYVIFYLKLLVESLSHNGRLRFSETIPYNEEMLSVITDINVDIVRQAIKIFTDLELMEILDDGTFYLSDIESMTGSTTEWAEKKKQYRLKHKEEIQLLEAPEVVEKRTKKGQKRTMSDKSIEIRDKSIDNIYIYIVDYLNEKALTNYRSTGKKTKELIQARLNEGFKQDDFKVVIDKKVMEWKGTEMEKFLTPDTLFSNKFEKYLNQNIKKGAKKPAESTAR